MFGWVSYWICAAELTYCIVQRDFKVFAILYFIARKHKTHTVAEFFRSPIKDNIEWFETEITMKTILPNGKKTTKNVKVHVFTVTTRRNNNEFNGNRNFTMKNDTRQSRRRQSWQLYLCEIERKTEMTDDISEFTICELTWQNEDYNWNGKRTQWARRSSVVSRLSFHVWWTIISMT